MRNLHIYPSPITHESRIDRITAVLANNNIFDEILVVGTQPGLLPAEQDWGYNRKIYRIPRFWEEGKSLLAKIIKTQSWTSSVLQKFKRGDKIHCISCHSLAVLPLATSLARKFQAKISYEPHELETETSKSRGFRKYLLKTLEKKYISYADATTVVSDEIANWYKKEYEIKNVCVVRNIAPTIKSSTKVNLREFFKLGLESKIFIYSGGLFPGRRVLQFIRIFSRIPKNNHLIFMGFGPLEKDVKDARKKNKNIHFLPAVQPNEVISYLKSADVGLSGVENQSLSYFYSLPNKIFEYMHAGLGSIVPNYPEMSRLVKRTGAGWVVIDESDNKWMETIINLDIKEIARARNCALKASKENTFEKEAKKICGLYKKLGFLSKKK